MIVIFKVIVNYDIIYDIIFVGQKYDIGQKYDNIRPNPLREPWRELFFGRTTRQTVQSHGSMGLINDLLYLNQKCQKK